MRAEALQELLQTPGGAGDLLLLLHEAAAEAGEQRLASFPPRAMAWLVLSPGWPVSLVSAGFPGDEGLLRDSAAIALLRSIVAANICTIQTGEPPWQEEWFVLSAEQQAVAIAVLSARFADEPEFFADQLREAAACMRGAIVGRTAPPQLERWMALAGEPLSDRRGVEAIAATLDAQVAAAIAQAHAAEQLACPAALRWIETAEPLMPIFFSSLELAIARSYRRLELFDRRSRDERLLRNAVPRPRQEAVIVALLHDETAWALHVMGHGGAGKTMLMRRVKTVLAEEHNLAVARIDFDNLNPNYPTRAPGLLLMGFAEELRLSDDAQAVDVFRRFDLSIRGVHERFESAVRVGSAAAAGGADRLEASYVEAENAFIAALQIIAREKRPLLILDTCEELAKARSVAGASTALQATFALLERLHREVPSLRVILSGRRRLAGGGHGWTAAGSALPKRHFLHLVNLRWFDEEEATEFLVGYTNEGLRLQAHLRQPILDELASNEHDPNRSIVWTAPPPTEVEGPRYNPYDLDMLASLGAQEPPPEPSVFASGRETYVRERIVGRVSAGVRSILAEIAILGRFDRDLVMHLLGGAGPEAEKIWDDLCDEPWIEVDRAARGGSTVWGMEPQLQERVCAYYKHAETASWHAARLRLRTLLPTITQERDWSELTPSYFVLALDMLANDPAAAARWWASVESHVAEKGAWEWAREITSLLLDEDDSGGASRCGLRAAVLALQAAAMLRLAPDQLGRLWKAVGDEAGRHPNRATQVMLSYRALAGAASDLRCRPDSVTESGIGALQEIVDRVPPFETLETGSAQAFGTEIGFIENCIELIERIEWRRSPPLSLLEPLRRRAELLHSLAAPSLGAYAKCLSARILALSNSVSVPEFDVPAESQDVPLHFLDWVAPTHLAARIRLEAARLNPRTLGPFRSSIDLLQSLDDDRYWSIRLQVAADNRPIKVPDRAIADSLRLARLPPDYVGHIAVPPLFCVGLEQRAMGGAPQESAAALSGAAADRSLPLETRLAAQRSAVRIGIRFRLYASPAVPYNLLEQSSRLSDAVLLAGRHALDPRQTDAEYAGRWRGAVAALAARGQDPKIEPSIEPDAAFAALSLALDDAEGDPERLPRPELQRWEEKHNGAWLESATLHARLGSASKARPRREASLLLDEGSFLALRQPALGASLLEVAVHLYHLVGDVAGEQLASISAALACARAGDRDRLQAILERPVLALDAVEALGPPWLYRLALARCRLEEFDQPGPATAAYSDGVVWWVGADMVGVVAGPHRAPSASMRARVPRASRAGKGIAVLLSMLATVLTAAAGVFGTLAIGETAAAPRHPCCRGGAQHPRFPLVCPGRLLARARNGGVASARSRGRCQRPGPLLAHQLAAFVRVTEPDGDARPLGSNRLHHALARSDGPDGALGAAQPGAAGDDVAALVHDARREASAERRSELRRARMGGGLQHAWQGDASQVLLLQVLPHRHRYAGQRSRTNDPAGGAGALGRTRGARRAVDLGKPGQG